MLPGRVNLLVGPIGWALLALALGGFGIGTGEFVALGLLPTIAGSLRVSIPHAGYLISAYALGVVLGAPLLTGAAVRLPRRRLLVVVMLAMAALNVISGLMPGFTSVLVLRFLAGLPHGAYFGVASVVAANLAPAHRRSSAMAVVFAGLTIANVIGVPATTWIGQETSWRVVFVLVAGIELLAAVAILMLVPVDRADREGSAPDLPQELRAFRQPQIWLSLSIAMIGGGALFATFSYIAPMMIHVAGFRQGAITPLLVLFGLGMTAGNLIGARLADRALMPTIYAALTCEIALAAGFYLADRSKLIAPLFILSLPATALALLPSLQSRIVSLAGGAPTLAAASIHAAFNIANSLGAWLGGLAIAAGWGYGSPNLVAAGLAATGLALALTSGRLEAARRHSEHRAPANSAERSA
jgi:MFS transporter, DHA1 family, inner membrane transport protein